MLTPEEKAQKVSEALRIIAGHSVVFTFSECVTLYDLIAPEQASVSAADSAGATSGSVTGEGAESDAAGGSPTETAPV